MTADNRLYRVTFLNDDEVYEIYAKHASESEMFGFIIVEDITFGETSELIVDPAEERLKVEFNSVKRTFIPVNSVIRIDEVSKQGVSKITEKSSPANNVRTFPVRSKKE